MNSTKKTVVTIGGTIGHIPQSPFTIGLSGVQHNTCSSDSCRELQRRNKDQMDKFIKNKYRKRGDSMNKKERKDLEETLDLLENLLSNLIKDKSVVIKEMDRINNLPTIIPVNEIIYDALTHYNTEVLDKEIIRVLKNIDRTKAKLK